MVRWLEPAVLANAALRLVISTVFGQYADKRESLGAAEEPVHDYRARAGEEFWLDFVADLGDGFDSTYALACLLGRASLDLEAPDGTTTTTPRGGVLVMGGDEIYPTPTRKEYEDRFRGPYEAALPWLPERADDLDQNLPHLFAIPGNHDWYDGLTNFPRFFCSDRQIGGWQTRQKRSYFGLRLPHGWWLLALDIQLDTYIDDPQIAYFTKLAKDIAASDRVILVTGKPSWVKVEKDKPLEHQPESYKNLEYFKKKVIKPTGAAVPITISGDLHHYVRYRTDDGVHLITAGGGGAYLYPTHTQEKTLHMPGEDGTSVAYECGDSLYPSRKQSKRLTWGALGLTWHAPRLVAVISVVYALIGASVFGIYDSREGWWGGCVAVVLLLVGALTAYADWKQPLVRLSLGGLHTALHVAAASLPAWVIAEQLDESGGGWIAATALASATMAFLAGGFVFGAYVKATHRGAHKQANEVLACQGIPDFKNFLRMRIDAERLTIYPVGVRKVPRKWEFDDENTDHSAPWLKPAGESPDYRPILIEDPIEVPAPRPPDSPE